MIPLVSPPIPLWTLARPITMIITLMLVRKALKLRHRPPIILPATKGLHIPRLAVRRCLRSLSSRSAGDLCTLLMPLPQARLQRLIWSILARFPLPTTLQTWPSIKLGTLLPAPTDLLTIPVRDGQLLIRN